MNARSPSLLISEMYILSCTIISVYCSIILIPDTISESLHIQSLEILIRIKSILIIIQLVIITITILSLLIIVVHIIHGIKVLYWKLFVILFHDFQIYLVMHLESLKLDLLSPCIIMDLHIVKNSIDQDTNVRVLIRK